MDDRHHNPSNFDRSPDEAGRDAFERGDAFGDELLSAYLDGECTAGEQAEAEARIAANPELRQLVDDLRNVRASLEVLPQHRLEANFAERVLRRAEREVLTGDRTFAPAVAQKTPAVGHRAPSPATSTPVNRRERFGSSRPFLWSVAALAAAILILVTNREPAIHQDNLARGPEAKHAPAAQSEKRVSGREQSIELSAEPQQEDGTRLADGLPDEQRKLGEPAATADDDGPPPPADAAANRLESRLGQVPPQRESSDDEFDGARNFQESSASGSRGAAADGPALRREPMPSSVAMDQRPNRDAPDTATSKVELETATKDVQSPVRSARMAPDRSRATTEEPAANPQSKSAAAAPAGTIEESAADLDQTIPPPGEPQPPATNGVDSANADPAFMDAVPAEPLRVVQVLVGRDAWQSGAVTELLKKNRIEVLNTTSSEELTQPSPTGSSAADKESERGLIEGKRTVEFAQQQALTDSLELMVVSAPSAQVAATLDDFRQQDQIRVMQVTDASAPEQLYEQSARALGNEGSRGGFAYGTDRLLQTEQAPADRAGKAELNETAGTQPADAKATVPSVESAKKDAQQVTGRADSQSAQKQAAVEKSGSAAQPDLSNEPAPKSPARRATATLTEADEARQSGAASGVAAPSFGGAPAGSERLKLQPRYGRGGGARYAVPTEAPTLRGGGFGGGGSGGAGYGMGDTAAGKSTSPAMPTDTPLGYGRRVTLQSPANYGAFSGGLVGRAVAPAAEAQTFSVTPSPAGSLGREQVLFFFYVVDTPLAAAADRANAAATPAGALEAGKPLPAKADDTNATPVPAPAPGPGSR